VPSIDVPEHMAAMREQPFKKTSDIPAIGIKEAQISATGWFSDSYFRLSLADL
jgi:hypothetical protein